MERKLLRKSARLIFLFSLKEAYLTCRNFLGLVLHPFKTIKVMERERDPLQVLIILGLPFYFWLGGVAAIITGRILIRAPFWQLGMLAKLSLLLVSFAAGIIFSYLGYWLFIWWRKRKAQ